MTQAVIFDLDGTLVDSCGVCVEILRDMISERGIDHAIDPVFARQYMSHGGASMVANLLGPAAKDGTADLAEFRERYTRTKTRVDALYPGVSDGLRVLSESGFRLAICSNKPQLLCDQVLRDTDIERYFEVVVGGQEGLRPKPETDLLDHTLDLLAMDAKHCIFIGDSDLDHAIATACGLSFHFMTYGYADPEWEPQGCHVHHQFDKMIETLKQSNVHAL